ncbi:MAG: hypothetical protein ACJ79K_12920 [Gemmatimonadaceae bacterium]
MTRYRTLLLAATVAACSGKAPRAADTGAAHAPADPDVAVQGTGVPAGFTAITDDTTAQITNARYVTKGGSWDVTTGPAHIIFAAKDTASGAYTATATFSQLEAPRHPEGYGIIVGGKDLASPNRIYTYFLVRGNGAFLVKSRNGAKTTDVLPWRTDPAVPKADSAGKARYRLAVRVATDSVRFMVNDKQVAAVKSGTVATDGVAGLRINHNLHVTTSPVAISR